MILLFPDPDTFRLVLTGGFVPADALLSEGAVSFDAAGRVAVETAARLPKKASAELTRLGVTAVRQHVGPAQPVSCWLQILPVTRDPAPPQLSSQAPVLFELENAADLPTIVGEMLRLGNDRQSLRWLAPAGEEKDRRVLLRVIGPPYYTLLRALDQTASGTAGKVRAYVEQAPRVWVQLGYSHPFAGQVKLADGQVLLIRPPRDWVYLPDAPYQDVYDILRFELPAGPVEWAETPVAARLQVPLRLVPGNAADAAELWVVRGNAVDQLDAFVRDADERITQRLKFAVARDPAGRTVIVLRVTTAKVAPPVLPLVGAVGFKPYYKLPNLYVPVGTRLHPTLRRDAVRKLLAEDTDQLVWLFPGPDGTFTPETLPEDSFRPLEDWVDYVVETHHAALSAWVDATRFDFEHFVCSETGGPKTRPDDGPGRGKKRGPKESDVVPLTPTAAGRGGARRPAEETDQATPVSTLPPVEVRPPSEWKVRRDELEKEFLAMDGPLDAPARQALWPKLAVANTGFGDTAEAAVCWANGLWEHDPAPREQVEGWFRTEFPDVEQPVTAAEFDQWMERANPTPGDIRQFVCLVLWLTDQSPLPPWFRDRLPAVQRYLEEHEKKLSVRAVWLAAYRLATLTGADTLGLARVRDRLLQRLLDEGLNSERDLPKFLRNAGRKDSDRVRVIQDRLTELHRDVRSWAEQSLKHAATAGQNDQGATLGYTDLFFAYALARLGETTPARALAESASRVLEGFKPGEDRAVAGGFLFRAYQYRIEQALAQKPHAGPLDTDLLEELDQIHAKSAGLSNSPHGMAHYAINRLRQQSRILDPQVQVDPYAMAQQYQDDVRKALAGLPSERRPAELARKVRELYARGVTGKATPEQQFHVLHRSVPLSTRVGEEFALELVALVPGTLAALKGVANLGADAASLQGELLERSLFLAAHYDRKDLVQQLVDQFVESVRAKTEEQRYELVNVVARQCLRSLRKLGMKDEVDQLLRRLQDVVLGGLTVAQIRQKYRTRAVPGAAGKLDLWSKALQTLLYLAGGWLTFGLTDQAAPILDEARAELIGPDAAPLSVKDYTALAQAYVAALGQGPDEAGLVRMGELFRKMKPERITNTWTTAKFYSRFHLNLIEETVLAVANEDFALGPAGRRWLDEDEYLVRRRIHRDVRRHLERTEL